MRTLILAFAIVALGSSTASAANTPCSGKKGGVAHCSGSKFVCRDGSVSASKKSCNAGGSSGTMWDGPPVDDAKPAPKAAQQPAR